MTPTTEQLKDLLAKVTPFPWKTSGPDEDGEIGTYVQPVDASPDENDFPRNWLACMCIGYKKSEWSANATLIALSPTLAAEVVRLREALERIDRLTEEAPFDFALIRLIARQANDATSEK